MFTTGRIIFTAVFVLVFVGALIWAYRSERRLNKVQFPSPWKVLLALFLFILMLWAIVKIRKFL
jgi:hypothetical protein